MSKLLGIDYGSKHVGLAISDDDQKQAFVYKTVLLDELGEHLVSIVKHESVIGVVIGLPLSLSGEEGPQAQKVKTFGSMLYKHLSLPIHYEDERLTSEMMHTASMHTGIDDHQLAAQEILQSYIDKQNLDHQ